MTLIERRARHAMMRDRYSRGAKVRRIASEFGVTESLVRYACRSLLPDRAARHEGIAAAIDAGNSVLQICRAFKVGPGTVRYVAAKYGKLRRLQARAVRRQSRTIMTALVIFKHLLDGAAEVRIARRVGTSTARVHQIRLMALRTGLL